MIGDDTKFSRRNFVRVSVIGAVSLALPKYEKTSSGQNKFSRSPQQIIPGVERLVADLDLPERVNAGVLAHRKLIHIIGGSSNWLWNWPTAEYSIFDPETLALNPKKEMPVPLARMAVGVFREMRGSLGRFEEYLMTIGGKMSDHNKIKSGSDVDHVFRYFAPGDKWYPLKPFPSPISSAKGVGVDGEIYIVGGEINNQQNLDIFRYDVYKEYSEFKSSWPRKTSIPTPVNVITATAKDKKIYIFGEKCNSERVKGDFILQTYNTQKDSWEKEKDLPGTPNNMYAFVCDDDLNLWTYHEGDHILYSGIARDKWERASWEGHSWDRTRLPEIQTARIPIDMVSRNKKRMVMSSGIDLVSHTERVVLSNHLYFVGSAPLAGMALRGGDIYRLKLPNTQNI